MIGMVHNQGGQEPTLVGRMPSVPGLPNGVAGVQIQGASGVQIQGPQPWEQAAATGSIWDRIAAKGYEIPRGGLGAPIAHGMGLGEFGVSDADLDRMAKSLAAKGVELTSGDIASAMEMLTTDERNALGAKLVALGVSSAKVTTAKAKAKVRESKTGVTIWGVLGTLSMAASVYHGYKRNDSVGWALWWGLMGGLFPVVTPAVAVAQGFGQPK